LEFLIAVSFDLGSGMGLVSPTKDQTMKTNSVSLIVAGLLMLPQAWAQQLTPPQTYFFTADSIMMGPMTVTVNRNGAMELVELATASGSMHLRILYDFNAHRMYTRDLSSDLCSTQEYTSSYVPGMHDPVGGSEEMLKEAGSLATIRQETVNGIRTRLVETNLPMDKANSGFGWRRNMVFL
jgi:hypothetical protein